MTGSQAYALSAQAWADGPERVLYERLGRELLAHCPDPIRGALVLDLGAGTGAVSRAALGCGARVVAADAAVEMLRHDFHARPCAVAADALRLPFAPAVFDGVLAAFVLNHLAEPGRALGELTPGDRRRLAEQAAARITPEHSGLAPEIVLLTAFSGRISL